MQCNRFLKLMIPTVTTGLQRVNSVKHVGSATRMLVTQCSYKAFDLFYTYLCTVQLI